MAPRTLVDIFRNLSGFQKPDLLLYKKDGAWHPISTKEFIERVQTLAAALEGLGVKTGDRVALLSENRPEWAIVDFACQCFGAILVPIFPTMVSEQAEYLLRDSGSVVAFCSNAVQAQKVLDARRTCPSLKRVVLFDEVFVKGTEPFEGVLVEGRKAHAADPAAFDRRADARRPDDLATLIYTSGTTGEPKGAMLLPEQLRLERPRLRRAAAAPADDGGTLVSSSLPRPRADGGVPLLPLRRDDRLRRVDRQAPGQPRRGEPAHLRRGAAGLREGLRPRHGQRLEGAGGPPEALLEGARRRQAGPRAPGAEEDPRRPPRSPALRLRPARPPQDPGPARLAVPLRASRAARRSRRTSPSSSGRRASRSSRGTA